MSFFIEINSIDIGQIPNDEVEILIDKRAMLPYIRTKSRDKGAKSSDKGAKSSNKGALSSDKGAISSDKGALSVSKRAMSVRKAHELPEFEDFDSIELL